MPLNRTSAGENHSAISKGMESSSENSRASITPPRAKPNRAGLSRALTTPPPPTRVLTRTMSRVPAMPKAPSRTSSLARCEKPWKRSAISGILPLATLRQAYRTPAAKIGASRLAASEPTSGTMEMPICSTSRTTVSASHWPGQATNRAQPCLSHSNALPSSTRRCWPLNCGAGTGNRVIRLRRSR